MSSYDDMIERNLGISKDSIKDPESKSKTKCHCKSLLSVRILGQSLDIVVVNIIHNYKKHPFGFGNFII
jgi:hypothetical protein